MNISTVKELIDVMQAKIDENMGEDMPLKRVHQRTYHYVQGVAVLEDYDMSTTKTTSINGVIFTSNSLSRLVRNIIICPAPYDHHA